MGISSVANFFSGWPLDWFILLALILILSADALRGSTVRSVSLGISFLLAPLVLSSLSHAAFLSSVLRQIDGIAWGNVALFAVVVVVLFALLLRILGSGYEFTSALQALASGIAASASIVLTWITTPFLQKIWHFSTQTQSIFAPEWQLWWLFVVFAAFAFSRD